MKIQFRNSLKERAACFARLALLCAVGVGVAGCSRIEHRRMADRDAYCLLGSRDKDPLYRIPRRQVEPDVRARFHDPQCPDRAAMPPDDPAATKWIREPGCTSNHDYDCCPVAASIENHEYLQYLPRDERGQIEITPQSAMELALLHSRDYQIQFEQIYLGALSLSGNRFEFSTQWNGGGLLDYAAAGNPPDASSILTLSDRLGFDRQLARGGQFATNPANSLSWQFADGQFSAGSGSIVASLALPLLRGAGRYVRLEGLIQEERSLLYRIRDFARFRRQFYFNTLNTYYDLLGQVQSIRNARINLQSLELNLIEHQELLAREMVSQIQVDQVYQQYQSGRISLLSSEQALADSLDRFKFQLGLPTWAAVRIDESLLEQFEFTSADLEALQQETDALFSRLLEYLPTQVSDDGQSSELTDELSREFFDRYQALFDRVTAQLPGVRAEFEAWKKQLAEFDAASADDDERLDVTQQEQYARQLELRLKDLEEALEQDRREIPTLLRSVTDLESIRNEPDRDPETPPEQIRWDRLQHAIGRRLREHLSELHTAQIQSRVFMLDLEPVTLEQETAMQFAIENRLDLKNSRAQVMDAWRGVEVAANALKSQLDVRASATLATDPSKNNPVRFDASAQSYNVSLNFDGPLNRLNERNAYRASQIAYQQARRQYMADEDNVLNSVKSNLRQLRIQRLNFRIARQQLLSATRQVDEAQFNLRSARESDSNLTRDLLQALQGLLGAKNDLIGNWIGYHTARINLFVELELLYLDEQGQWINERESLNELTSRIQSADERAELSRIYGIMQSPLFQTVDDEVPSESKGAETGGPLEGSEQPGTIVDPPGKREPQEPLPAPLPDGEPEAELENPVPENPLR